MSLCLQCEHADVIKQQHENNYNTKHCFFPYVIISMSREQHWHNNITKNQSNRRKNCRTQSTPSTIFKMAATMTEQESTGAAREIKTVNPVYLKWYFRSSKLSSMTRSWTSRVLSWLLVQRLHATTISCSSSVVFPLFSTLIHCKGNMQVTRIKRNN